MYFVYFLQSLKNSHQIYIGYSINIEQRLETHNSGRSVYTAKYRPWTLKFYIAFENSTEAKEFESYLKTPPGKSLIKKRFLPKNF